MYKAIHKVVLIFITIFLFVSRSMAYEVETQELYISRIDIGQIWNDNTQIREGIVNFSVADPSPDLCVGTHFSFNLSKGVAPGVEKETSYGQSFLAILVLAKIYHLPVRVKYETDALPIFPQILEGCGDVRHIPTIKWLGIDKQVMEL